MAKKINDELEKGKKLLKDMTQESGYLYDALTSIGENIATAIENAIDGATDLDEVGQKIANTYKRDIVNSVKASARGMGTLVDLQGKINKGQNVSKQIDNTLAKNQAKRQVLANRILMARRAGIPIRMKDIQGVNKMLKLEAESLKKLQQANIEEQKKISIYKLASSMLGDMANKIDKSGTLSKILSGNFKDTFTAARFGQATMVSLVSFMVKAVLELDKIMTGLNRQFGFTDKQAMAIQNRFEHIAQNSKNVLMSFRDVHKTVSAITEQTGIFAGHLNNEILDGATGALEYMNLSADAVARLAYNANTTGLSFAEQELSMARGVIAAEAMFGVNLDANAVFEESAKQTGVIRANLGRNYEHIAKTVGAAQALGLTMQDLEGISRNLLNFHQSIEAEMTAELFIGKELNLEKARLYALTGDYDKLQKEILKNIGTEYDFLTMNTIAKDKYAAALGMSVNQMSDLVMKNADLAAIEEQALRRGDYTMVEEMKKLQMQKEFNKLIVKLQTTFVNLASGPLGDLASLMSTILGDARLLYGVVGLIAAVKIAGLISGIYSLASALSLSGVAAMSTVSALTLGIGIAAVAAGIWYGTSVMEKAKTQAASVPKLAEGGIVTKETTAVIGEAGSEAVVPLDAWNERIDTLINATKENKPHKLLAKWETSTKFR